MRSPVGEGGIQHWLWQASFALLCLFPALLALTRAGADVALCLIAAMFLLASALGRDWAWTQQPEIRVLAALWVYLWATAWLTPIDPAAGFQAGLIWGRLVLFYAAMRYWLLRTSKELALLSATGMAIIVLLALDTAWQYVTGEDALGRPLLGDRLSGPLNTPNIGNLLLKVGLPVLGLTLYGLVTQGRARYGWGVAALALALMALVLVSGERSIALLTLLALAVGGGIVFWYAPPLRRHVLGFCFAAAALLALLAATQAIVQSRGEFLLRQLADFWNSTYGQLFTASYRLWQEHPWFGIGAQQFVKACPTAMERFGIAYCDMHPHNLYLEWLVDTGIIGLGLFLLALGIMMWQLLREISFTGWTSILTACACTQLAVLLFPLIVTQSQFSNWPGMLFWYSLSLGLCLPRMAVERRQ